MPPGTKQFPSYFRDRLDSAMKNETYHFVSHLLKQNRPITEFIDADYRFSQRSSCPSLWSIRCIERNIYKTQFSPDSRRGGLLGQASVLTATANGVETSPVTRGVWNAGKPAWHAAFPSAS